VVVVRAQDGRGASRSEELDAAREVGSDAPWVELCDEAPPPGLIRDGTVGVPRRFGTVRVLGLIPVFALMFGLMQWLGTPPSIFVGVTVFVVLVGAGQAILFGGRAPRKASFVGGLVAGPIVGVLIALLATRIDNPSEVSDPWIVNALAVMFGLFGAPLGYLAGGVMAAIFLVRGRDLDDVETASRDAATTTTPPADPFGD
jgi:hypothetical protein